MRLSATVWTFITGADVIFFLYSLRAYYICSTILFPSQQRITEQWADGPIFSGSSVVGFPIAWLGSA